MTADRASGWAQIGHITGPCIRPGGIVLTERALEVCSLRAGARVADIGCGAGGTLERLERAGIYRPVGLDCSETLLGQAIPRLASTQLVLGRAETLPFGKGAFDALFCECVLSILRARMTALREYARVLKEGGFLIVSDVFGEAGPGRGQPEGRSRRIGTRGPLRKEDLFSVLAGLGFSVLLWEEHGKLLKQFAARMILAGISLPDLGACGQGQEGKKGDRGPIGYFLLVARRVGDRSSIGREEGGGNRWTR